MHPVHGVVPAGVASCETGAWGICVRSDIEVICQIVLDGLAIFVFFWNISVILGGNEGKMWKY